jgi:hypothetical protein
MKLLIGFIAEDNYNVGDAIAEQSSAGASRKPALYRYNGGNVKKVLVRM